MSDHITTEAPGCDDIGGYSALSGYDERAIETRPHVTRLRRVLALPLLYKVLFANSVVVLLGATLGTYLATRINTSGGLPMLIVFIATGLLVSVAINFALLKLALTPITRLRETMKLAQAAT